MRIELSAAQSSLVGPGGAWRSAPSAGRMLYVFRKHAANETDAAVVAVKMTDRLSYGEAKVSVTYRVEPLDRPAFQAVRDLTVKMQFLPQAGQRLRVGYDPEAQRVLDVLTPPGQEVPPPAGSAPTEEIPWRDGGRANWWANGTRRS